MGTFSVGRIWVNMLHKVRMGGPQDTFILRIVGNLCLDGWVPRLVY